MEFARAFQSDPATRRLLEACYGRAKAAPPPRPPQGPPLGVQPPFERPQHSGAGSRDPRAATVDAAAVARHDATRPRPQRPAPAAVPAVDQIAKRRSKAAIDQENVALDAPAAPLSKGRNTEAEKRRLQSLFTFKGGKALPAAGLAEPVVGQLPLSLITGRRAGGVR